MSRRLSALSSSRQAGLPLHGLAHDVRGVAQAELLLALPTMILILVAMIAVFWLAASRMRAHGEARACAWDYAVHACDVAQTQLCASVRARSAAAAGSDLDGLDSKLSELPLLGDALLALFGAPALAERQYDAHVLPGENRPRKGSASITLVCAPPAESVAERMKGALCDLANTALGGKDVPGCK